MKLCKVDNHGQNREIIENELNTTTRMKSYRYSFREDKCTRHYRYIKHLSFFMRLFTLKKFPVHSIDVGSRHKIMSIVQLT